MGSITSKNKKQKSDEHLSTHTEEQQCSEKISPSKKRKVGDKDSHLRSRTDSSRQSESKEEPTYVYTRKGSMYFDDEGSLAHEFYEEVRPEEPGAKPYMKRQLSNLTPQGEVSYNYPRLKGDCDIIICDP